MSSAVRESRGGRLAQPHARPCGQASPGYSGYSKQFAQSITLGLMQLCDDDSWTMLLNRRPCWRKHSGLNRSVFGTICAGESIAVAATAVSALMNLINDAAQPPAVLLLVGQGRDSRNGGNRRGRGWLLADGCRCRHLLILLLVLDRLRSRC